jgi:hypothetical protein
MIHDIKKYGLYLLLTTALFVSNLVQAADKPIDENPTPRDEVLRLINLGLPNDHPLRGDTMELVQKMMAVRIGPPLSKTFDPNLARRSLLPRGSKLDPKCRQLFTESGDPDLLPCIAFVGTPEGTGPYSQLSYSKHMALGDIGYFNRPTQSDIGIGDLKPVQMSDEEAYLGAQKWLADNFGLGQDEMPVPPDGVKNPFPVKNIAMGVLDEQGNMQSVEAEKLVVIARGLPAGLGGNYDWLPAPGKAIVAMDDSGVNEAVVRRWQELAPDPAVDPRNAKSLDELTNEIADDLLGLMKGPINRIQIVLSFGVRPPTNNQILIGLLLPAVQVFVSSVPADLDEGQQQELANTQVSTASVVREFSLVKFPDDHPVSDEE